MALAYRPPSVSIEETVTPSISPILAAPALVSLVGPSQGFQTRTDQFAFSGTNPIALPGLPTGASLSNVLAVVDSLDPTRGQPNGSGYSLTADYTVNTTNGTVTRVASGAIADGRIVSVQYTYVVADYFLPTRLYDLGSVESRYGAGLTPDGLSINSPVSYAASIAFENGTDSVVIQPLFSRATPGDPTSKANQPTSNQIASTATWSDTLFGLRDIEDINVIVPVIGQSAPNIADATQLAIFQTIQDHLQFMSTEDQYLIGLFGEDASSSASLATRATINSHGNTLRSRYGGALAEQSVLVNIAKLTRSLPVFGQSISVGAQYAAAGLAGMLAAQPVSSSLTRKALSGFTGIVDYRSLQDKNEDAANGLLVLEQKSGNCVVRHSITLDNTQAARRELSVVRAKHRVIESVRDTLDRQIIGNITADGNAPGIVSAAVIAVLEQLRQAKDLVDYGGVQARILALEPTTVEVRFSYRPAFPLNYINVLFSLDLSTGDISVASSTT